MVLCVQSRYLRQFMVVKFPRLRLTRYRHLRMDHPTVHSWSSSHAVCCSSLLRLLLPPAAAALSILLVALPLALLIPAALHSPTLLPRCRCSCCSGWWRDRARGRTRGCARSTGWRSMKGSRLSSTSSSRPGRLIGRERIAQWWARTAG